MTYPYTSGQIVTANDLNQGGLHLITPSSVTGGTLDGATVNIGTAVSSITVSGVFSADFDNYIIFSNGGACSTDDTWFLTYGSSTTSYYGKLIYGSFASSGVATAEDNNASRHTYNGGGNSSVNQVEIHVYNPYLSIPTEMWSRVRYSTVYGTYVGYHGSFDSHTSFTLARASGTITGGTIRVYGYSNG